MDSRHIRENIAFPQLNDPATTQAWTFLATFGQICCIFTESFVDSKLKLGHGRFIWTGFNKIVLASYAISSQSNLEGCLYTQISSKAYIVCLSCRLVTFVFKILFHLVYNNNNLSFQRQTH